MTALETYLEAMRSRTGALEDAQLLDDLWFKMTAEERQQAHRELQMRPANYFNDPRGSLGESK